MSKSKRIKDQIISLFLLILFVVWGLSFIDDGIFVTTIEIDHTGTETIAHIHKKTMFSPFKKTDIVVPKVYQVRMKRNAPESLFTALSYRVELKASNWKIVPVTTNSILRYFSNRKLTNQINESIQNKVPFRTEFREVTSIFLGAFIIMMCYLFVVIYICDKKEAKLRMQERRTRRRMKMKMAEENPEYIQQSAEPKPEKYKNINDSIIK